MVFKLKGAAAIGVAVLFAGCAGLAFNPTKLTVPTDLPSGLEVRLQCLIHQEAGKVRLEGSVLSHAPAGFQLSSPLFELPSSSRVVRESFKYAYYSLASPEPIPYEKPVSLPALRLRDGESVEFSGEFELARPPRAPVVVEMKVNGRKVHWTCREIPPDLQ